MLTSSITDAGLPPTSLEPALERMESARAAARERLRAQCPAGRPEWLRLESRREDLHRRLSRMESPQAIGQGVRELCWLFAEELAGAYGQFLRQP